MIEDKNIYAYNESGAEQINSNEYMNITIYDLYLKAESGALSRDDKNNIVRLCMDSCMCHQRAIMCMGVIYDFTEFMDIYVYKQYGNWYEIAAIDKTSIRANIYGRIDKIIKVE